MQIALPPVRTQKLAGREIWAAARRSYLRVGWFYQCSKCDRWHLDLAGGYAITADGAVATCHHVAETPEKFVKGHMIAATDDGRVFPVTAIIAANAKSDACIIRVKSDVPLTPMPLSDAARPGDTVYCFSDPMGFRGYFSQGMVNRYYRESPRKREARMAGNGPPTTQPERLNRLGARLKRRSHHRRVRERHRSRRPHHAGRGRAPEEERRDGTREELGTLMVIHNAVPGTGSAGVDREGIAPQLSRSGTTSTATVSFCAPAPSVTPRSGLTSEKSRPHATVMCRVEGSTSFVGSASIQPA